MNIKIRNTLAEITGASLAMIWMWLNLTDASIMTIQSVSQVLAQGIGGSIVLIIALHILFNILLQLSLDNTKKILMMKEIKFLNSTHFKLVVQSLEYQL